MLDAKKSWVRGSVTSILLFLLLVFFVGEVIVEKFFLINPWPAAFQCVSPMLTRSSPLLPSDLDENSTGNSTGIGSFAGIKIRAAMPLEDAYSGKILNVSHQVSELAPKGIRTEFEENRNIGGYGLTIVKNVCFLPDGPIVVVNMTEEDLNRTLSASRILSDLWNAAYNSTCGWCTTTGSRMFSDTPEGAKWIRGNTTHILPYLGNIFHNFAERIWPHLASHQYPLNETSMQPINHFLVHRFSTWMQQAKEGNHERETVMLQFRILAELSPQADFVVMDSPDQHSPVCFERLTLDCSSCDRMSDLLGSSIFSAAVLSYRRAAFDFFKVPAHELAVSSPPQPLRVAFYGRSDTRRRRVVNTPEIVEHLRARRNPPLDILVIDDLLRDGRYNQTLAETVSLFSQTDLLITVHGANTWAAMFMPPGAAVIEIYGPCGPGTWIQGIASVLGLKHDTGSNPWRDKVPSPLAGNTTKCEGFYQTPDFTLDAGKLDEAVKQLALPRGPDDRIPLHWLFDWKQKRYLN